MNAGSDSFSRWKVPVRSSERKAGAERDSAAARPGGGAPKVEADPVEHDRTTQADDTGPDDGDAVDAEVVDAELVEEDVADAGGGVGGPGPSGDPTEDGESTTEPGDPADVADVVALTAERDEYLGALQRLQAEFANYRKRVQRQQEEQSARAAADLVVKLLPVVDALDLAEAHLRLGDGPASAEATALIQARALLVDALAREGLERVDEADVPFDPVIHDAVAHVPADENGADDDRGAGPSGETPPAEKTSGDHVTMVDGVLRAGYRWRDQVLRPAMVRVRG